MSAAPYPWTDELLDAARSDGDPEADALAQRMLAGEDFAGERGRLGYHRMLDLADRLIEAPELYLVPDSRVRAEFARMPAEFQTYFDPQELPEWVDAGKLALASRVWDENMLAVIWVLYAASLPSCYLVAKGIPALYDSGKLAQHRFIYQRIYETGLMLDAVMEPGGLRIVEDVEVDARPGGTRRRFVWGRGFIAARKVRLLHAAMRAMLMRPDVHLPADAHARAPGFARSSAGALTAGLSPYDCARLGTPVNQEDLAYTLLTFGYCIPAGLGRWGCRLSDAQREAFLHTWRLVGHLMGIRAELLPVDWAAAGHLFATVQRRQKGTSPMAVQLTRTLGEFLQDYLPPRARPALPAMLIISQLGAADAALILPPDTAKPTAALRALFAGGLAVLHVYYWLRGVLLHAFPAFGKLLDETFRHAGDALVDSWRDDYDRRPFFIPDSAAADWRDLPGVDGSFRDRLRRWRARLFNTVVYGVAGVVLGTVLLLVVPVVLVVAGLASALATAAVASAIWVAGILILHGQVGRVVRRRPEPQPPPGTPAAPLPRPVGSTPRV